MATSLKRARVAFVLFGFTVRLYLAMRPLDVVDRLFVPDDAGYTLAIVRSIARGLGPTADGVHLTTGFQPLFAFLLVPIARISSDPDVLFRAALILGALADVAVAWLVGSVAARVRGHIAALVATALWSMSTAAVANALDGLETSLALACTLGALVLWMDAASIREEKSDAKRGDEPARIAPWALTGVAAGACLLARVDTVFFVAALGIATLLRRETRGAIACAGAAAITVAPWWIYTLARFGTIVPESGAAVREQTLLHAARGIVVRDQIAWAAGASVGPPLFDSTWARTALGEGASGVGCALGVLLFVGCVHLAVRRRTPDAIRILAVPAACLFAFYALYLPAIWFFRRYLAPVHMFATLLVALAIHHAWEERATRPRLFRVVASGLGASFTASLVILGQLAIAAPTMTPDQGYHGAKGYRAPSRELLAALPDGAVVGAFQSGMLGWAARDGVRVVNFDGVVDAEAARAIRNGSLAAFARSRGVTHFCDWQINVDAFVARSGDPRITAASLRPIREAERQGEDDRFVLYEIDWPRDSKIGNQR